MTKRLILTDEGAYVVDMSFLEKMLTEPMPMTVAPPPNDRIQFRTAFDYGPVIQTPSYILCSAFDDASAWKFFYLFPLGKRAYVRKK